MKYCFIFLFLFISCGEGTNDVAHTAICDGYQDWNTSEYILPFPSGITHEVSQANCGAFTHLGSHQYAYDIIMNISDSIVAARAGTVIDVEESFEDGNGCPDDNHVYVEHSDGSIAFYVHLTNNGSLVNVGDSVTQGMAIGLAGNTGCSTASHLHFVVFKDNSYKESLPITFKNTAANPRGLAAETSYTAQ